MHHIWAPSGPSSVPKAQQHNLCNNDIKDDRLQRFIGLFCCWVASSMVLQLVMCLAVKWVMAAGVYTRTHHAPSAPMMQLLAVNLLGTIGYVGPLAFLQAYARMEWSYATPNLLLLSFWPQLMMLYADTFYYFMHRWYHSNKLAYKLFHAKHHSPEGSMGVATWAYVDPLGAVLEGGVSVMAITAMTYYTSGNFWYLLASILHLLHTDMMGHSGTNGTVAHPRELLLHVINPMAVIYHLLPCKYHPIDHEQHHRHPRADLAPFFSLWDDFFGTRSKTCNSHKPISLLVVAVHICYVLGLLGGLQLLFTHPLSTLLAYLLAYVAVSPRFAAVAFDAFGVPEVARYVFGGLMDTYRQHNHITYAAPGDPGYFGRRVHVPNAASATPQSYIFACHPTGVISRSPLLTFAARGWESPVSSLSRVRLAVSSTLLRLPIPLSRELLLAIGCVPADAYTIQQHLLSGTSVAVTPGGWQEPTHTGRYDLLLKNRTGFISMALKTGAQLVPVLCLGEPLVAASPHLLGVPGFNVPWVNGLLVRFLMSERPNKDVHVVFGEPVCAQEGEGVQQLHQRYIAALLALGKQHEVTLNII